MLVGVDLAPSGPSASSQAPLAAAAPAVECPHADCAQPNPAGRDRCIYCDRPLAIARFTIAWPWGETASIGAELHIGRAAPAAPALIARLEAAYDNVSRRHAVLRAAAGGLTIEDLGSVNGTFVNQIRIPPHQAVRLHAGTTVRFAADLTARIDGTG